MTGVRTPRPAALAAAGLGATMLAAGVVVAVLAVTSHSPPPRPEEVTGTMKDASDQSDVPGASTSGGTVIAVPAAALAGFWRQTSSGHAPEPNQLRYSVFGVPRAAVEDVGGVAGEVSRRGRFALRPVSSGPYLLCYARRVTNAGEYRVQGCAQAELQVPGRLEASRGEAGFRVTPRGPGG